MNAENKESKSQGPQWLDLDRIQTRMQQNFGPNASKELISKAIVRLEAVQPFTEGAEYQDEIIRKNVKRKYSLKATKRIVEEVLYMVLHNETGAKIKSTVHYEARRLKEFIDSGEWDKKYESQD